MPDGKKLFLTGSPGTGVVKSELIRLKENSFYYLPLQMDLEIVSKDDVQMLVTKRSGNIQEWIKQANE
ncbi:MAG: hypothetical protein EOO43_03630 [Flavobacterium sp.]|nr:MAG: hypothetical protein EOO43_03630 [Flavobacterium sp.]